MLLLSHLVTESCYRDWDMLLGLEGQHWAGSDRYQFADVPDVASSIMAFHKVLYLDQPFSLCT